MAKINRQEILKYTIVAIIFVLSIKAKINDYILPASLALYIAFTYVGLQFAIISPLYIISCLINGLTLESLIYAISPVILMFMLKYIFYFAKTKMPKWLYILCAFLSQIPIIFIYSSIDERINCILSWVILTILTYISMNLFYAIFIRKTYLILSVDEVACAFIVIAFLALGLYRYNFEYFSIYRVILSLISLICVFVGDIKKSIILLCAYSLGEALAVYDAAIVGATILCFLGAYCFRKLNKPVYSIANFLLNILCGFYLYSYVGFSIFQLISSLVGVIIFLIIPQKIIDKLSEINNNKQCLEGLVRRDRYSIVKRLNMAEGIMYELATIFKTTLYNQKSREMVVSDLSKDIVLQTCAICENKDKCFNTISTSPEVAMRSIVDNALLNTDSISSSLPIFFQTKCIHQQKLITSIMSIITNYKENSNNINKEKEDNRFLAIQLIGLGSIVSNISQEIKNYPSINEDLSMKIKAELGYYNIVCSEVLILNKKEKNEVVLIVRKKDSKKPEIVNVLNKILNDKLYKIDEEDNINKNYICLYYESIPKYDVAYYDIVYSKQGALKCGDSHSIIKIKEDKVLIILCDGMGSGQAAQKASIKTLNLVQDFYKAGLDNSKALVLINKALSHIDKDNFTALDMCVLDLNYGNIDFIKSGAVPSFIKRKNEVLTINSGALPLGIIDSARPIVNREVLSINDIVILVSDGILDILKVEGIKEILQKITTSNPKTICEEIIGQAGKLGLKDDSSVIVFKMFKNI